MPKTIVVQDATVADLLAQLGAGGVSTPVVTPPQPPQAPPGVRVIPLPWLHRDGLPNVVIGRGEVVAFAITPPASAARGVLGNFSVAPTGDNDDQFRDLCLSDKPGDFSGALAPSAIQHGKDALAVFFSVGGSPTRTVAGRTYPDTSNPNLEAGRTYYVNVRQAEATVSCRINYGLAPV